MWYHVVVAEVHGGTADWPAGTAQGAWEPVYSIITLL